MAEETPMSPVSEAVPPKANPLGAMAVPRPSTLKLNPQIRKPTLPGAAAPGGLRPGIKLPPKPGATLTGLKPGLKLPPKPGATVTATRPGLKLPPQPGLKPGVKLPTQSGLKPGIKLPTAGGIKPGVKLPARPVIHKPGSTVVAQKPQIAPSAPAVKTPAVAPAAELPKVEQPVAELPKVEQPVAELPKVEQPVAELPKVETPAAAPKAETPVAELPKVEEPVAALPADAPKALDQLKAVTQNLKSLTGAIPQKAVLRKTGIIADQEMTEAQKQAVKSKTARISLSDAMGVAPVKDEILPMKTIRIKRPTDLPGTAPTASKPVAPAAHADASAKSGVVDTAAETKVASAPSAETAKPAAPATTFTQRKTIKITRPTGGAVRPAGKFGIRKPSAAPAASASPAAPAATPAGGAGETAVADIPDMPSAAVPPAPAQAAASSDALADAPAFVVSLSLLVQAAACVAIAALAWLLYQDAITVTF